MGDAGCGLALPTKDAKCFEMKDKALAHCSCPPVVQKEGDMGMWGYGMGMWNGDVHTRVMRWMLASTHHLAVEVGAGMA